MLSFEAQLVDRGADDYAAFLLDHLHPGMCVLDCECGAGSISVGLARALDRGPVIALDCRYEGLRDASAYAASHGIVSLAFVGGDAYQLPFGDAS